MNKKYKITLLIALVAILIILPLFKSIFGNYWLHVFILTLMHISIATTVRMVMQVNQYKQGDNPYGFRNLGNIVKDFEMTHGIDNWRIAVVVHSGGGNLVLNNKDDNPLLDKVTPWVSHPNVDVYFCLNTAAAKGWKTDQIIDGVKFVPAGLSAIMDLQYQGYKYVQP